MSEASAAIDKKPSKVSQVKGLASSFLGRRRPQSIQSTNPQESLERTDIKRQLLLATLGKLISEDAITMKQWPHLDDSNDVHEEKFIVLDSPDKKVHLALATRKDNPLYMTPTNIARISWWETKTNTHGTVTYIDYRQTGEPEHPDNWPVYEDKSFNSHIATKWDPKTAKKDWFERGGAFCNTYGEDREMSEEELRNLEAMITNGTINHELTDTALKFSRDKLHMVQIGANQLQPPGLPSEAS